jgi:hypothetical protein
MPPQLMIVAAVPIAVVVLAACSSEDAAVSPNDFVIAHAQDAHSVVVSVQEVQAGVGIMTNAIMADDSGGGDTSALASFDGVLSDAQSSFDKVNQVLLEAPKPKGVESSETEMWSATDELSSALKSARAFVDDQKPSEMADFKTHWDQGRAWWNQAVTKIWQAASATAPTMDNAPTAPPPTP